MVVHLGKICNCAVTAVIIDQPLPCSAKFVTYTFKNSVTNACASVCNRTMRVQLCYHIPGTNCSVKTLTLEIKLHGNYKIKNPQERLLRNHPMTPSQSDQEKEKTATGLLMT
jgi:hypothetical protein